MHTFALLVIYLEFVSATLYDCLRVVGGTVTNIFEYPTVTAVLKYDHTHYDQICGGIIINERHVLSVAHCFVCPENSKKRLSPRIYRVRVGSSTAHINGFTHDINTITYHPNWNADTYDSDVAIMFTASDIVYSRSVRPAVLAHANYQFHDNEPVWAIGWGFTAERGRPSEKLRHVKVWTINQSTCKELYKHSYNVTDNMMCSGWLEIGGRDHCTHDSGSPVFHYGIVVGISSLGIGCGQPCYPGINVRVSRFTDWIISNTNTILEQKSQ